MKEKDKNKRREILALGLIAGAGALVGGGIHTIASNTSNQKIKMMTADGKLVEVDSRHLPDKLRESPVSNAELKEWMENEKNKTSDKPPEI